MRHPSVSKKVLRFQHIAWDGQSWRLPNKTRCLSENPEETPACLTCEGVDTQVVTDWFQIGMIQHEAGIVAVCPVCWHTSTFFWYIPVDTEVQID